MDQRTKKTTREKLVEVAMELFAAQGYHATGLKQVLDRSEVNAGSLYYFFRTKEDLLLAVLDQYAELLHPIVMAPAWENVDDPIDRIFAVLGRYREWMQSAGCTGGCPIGNLALEVADARPAVREKIALNFTSWCKAIEACLDEAADRLPPELDRAALSRFVLTVMEGSIMQARAHKDLGPFDLGVGQLRDYFDRLLAARAID